MPLRQLLEQGQGQEWLRAVVRQEQVSVVITPAGVLPPTSASMGMGEAGGHEQQLGSRAPFQGLTPTPPHPNKQRAAVKGTRLVASCTSNYQKTQV